VGIPPSKIIFPGGPRVDQPMDIERWDPDGPGVLRLPSGRLVRGRSLRRAAPEAPPPTFGIYLVGKPPVPVTWESRWLHWPDFRLPADPHQVRRTLAEVWARAATERVELACTGGRGRTGTALACLAILDGVPNARAVAYVREHYDGRAVETPGQRRFVARWTPVRCGSAGPGAGGR
jgi:hypothetical protein